MINKWIPVVLFLSITAAIFGQSLEDFNDAVDFDATINTLQQTAARGDVASLPKKFVIVEGVVASRLVVNGNTANYIGEIDLITGEWLGVEKVVRYECILRLVGPQFAKTIPARQSRNPDPMEITLNSRILVVARATDIRRLPDGSLIPVLDVVFVRHVQ